jgi:CBS domain-containing protein
MSGTSLGTLVTYNPWSIGPTVLLDEIAMRFEDLRIHHVAVVDDERHVLGMISETDLIRARQSQRMTLAMAGGGESAEPPAVFARDAMSRDVLTIDRNANFRDALGLLLKKQIHALPAVQEERLVGMISSRDFLREFSYGELPGSREPISSLPSAKPLESLTPDMSLDEALLAMQEAGVSTLVVAQGDCPIGVVTQRDIVREKYGSEDQSEPSDGARASKPLLKVARNSPPIRSGQRLCEAAAAMIDHSLPAVTVVNQSNRLLGLITEDDLLRVLYDALA